MFFFFFFFHLLYAWLYLFRPGLHSQAFTIFTFCQEKHTFSSVINSCYWRLLFKGWHAAEEGTCSGRLRPGSQASGDRGPAAEHRHIARAPARYLKGLCVIHYFLNFKLHGIHHVQHLLFFYFFFFFHFKRSSVVYGSNYLFLELRGWKEKGRQVVCRAVSNWLLVDWLYGQPSPLCYVRLFYTC